MAADVTPDPLIPYFMSVDIESDCGSKRRVPIWRGLLESEVGLEYLLQKLPPHSVEGFRSQNSLGRAALEDGAWERAESSFLHCKDVLKGVSEHVEKRVYDFLLAWAYLPLAQLYQLRGTAQTTPDSSMLQKAMNVRNEMLKCVMPLRDSHALLVKVCKSSYFTVLYEYGDLIMFPKVKDDAVHKYAELMSCDNDEAEAHLCVLLWCDHYYSGNFEVSLRWIQEANRLWKKMNTQVWSCRQNEAELLMKLGKLPEAVIVLEDLMPYSSGDDQQQNRELLRQCYTQMSRRAEINGDPHQADHFNGLALSYYDPSLRRDDNQENVPCEFVKNPEGFVIIPDSHPIMMRPPVPVGSWLGLVQADMNSISHVPHFRKLPEPIKVQCLKYHLHPAQAAMLSGDWYWATCNYQMCREFLKITKKIVDPKTYDWLLTWVDLPLAYLYQYHVKKSEKAIEMWKEMKDCAMHQMLSDEFLTRGYVLNLDVAEYEWMRSSTSEGHVEILRRRAECSIPRSNEKEVECELCFWLYFHHHTQGNYEVSLGWLREAKRLKEEHCPDQECSVDPKDYFCCEYTFLRCEADLWMRLQMFEKAISSLKDLLKTRHVHQGSPRLAREAKRWLHQCESQVLALDCIRISDNHEQEEIADESPSSTGCISLQGVSKFQLVQSQTGLEHHLHKLPVPIHMAFRRHSDLGRAFQHFSDWESAVFNFEWCKQLLKLSIYKIETETYQWLMVWADVPLVELYEFRKMQYRKALDLRREMLCMVPKGSEVYIALLFHIQAGMYQCAVSDHPEVKDVVVCNFTKLFGLGDNWACEERCLLFLYQKYLNYGNLEASLHYIRQAKQHLSEQEQDDKKSDYVLKEALCLVCLHNFDEAEKLMREHHASTNKNLEDLPARLQTLMMACKTRRLDDRTQFELLQRSSSGLIQLRLDSLEFEEKNEYEEAVKCHESCLEKINQARTDSDSDPTDYGHSSGVYDYFRLGTLHKEMFSRRIPSLCGEQIKAFQQDEHFSRAVQYFKKSIELSSPQIDPLKVADVNYLLVQLYGTIDEIYGSYILRLYDQLNQQRVSVPYSSSGVCVNDADRLLLQESCNNLVQVIKEYLAFQNPMPIYETVASGYYTSSLYTMENQSNIEGWIEVLESHSYMYSFIQSYYYRRATVYSILDSFRDQARYQEQIEYYSWMAFMYAERERTRVMLYQIGSDRLNYSASRKLWSFDVDDAIAVKAIRRDCETLLQGDAVFVQYSPLPDMKTYLIYVVDQKGNLSVTHTIMEHEGKRRGSAQTRSVERSLTRLYKFLEPKKSEAPGKPIDYAPMMKELEFLYDVLIEPIAERLAKMKKEHKLILAPSKLLTKVPFAALRNSQTSKYLIQRHTIASTTSLRALKICSERLQDLQSSAAEIGFGSIVALGDPAYKVCLKCQYMNLKRLEWSAKEVEYIANLFDHEKAVVKVLLREKATAEELLDWAARPSREGFRQALIHIGSHARVLDDKDHGKNALHLACPLANSVNIDPPTVVDERKPGVGLRTQIEEETKEEDYNDEEVTDFDDDDEISEDAYSDEEVTNLDEVAQNMIKSGRSISSRFIEQAVGLDRNTGNPVSGQGPLRRDAVTGTGRSEPGDSWTRSNKAHDLTAEDISSLEPKWMAELVVLSACSSSRGKRTAEGVLSLARAFMIAGVPCVVASQWKVDDFVTASLMEMFYEELGKGTDVTSALCSAMRRGLEKYPVKDWAPFSVWGVPTLRIPQALQRNA